MDKDRLDATEKVSLDEFTQEELEMMEKQKLEIQKDGETWEQAKACRERVRTKGGCSRIRER